MNNMFGWLMKQNRTLSNRVELIDTHDSWGLIARTHRSTSSFSVANAGAIVTVQFNNVTIDALAPEDTFFPSNNYTVNIPIGGIWNYSFHGKIGVGPGFVLFRVNGTTREVHYYDTGGVMIANGSEELSEGDDVTIAISQSTGSSQFMSGANSFGVPDNAFTIWKLEGQ